MRANGTHRLPRWVGVLSLGLILGIGGPAFAQPPQRGAGPGGAGPGAGPEMMGSGAACGYGPGMMGRGFGPGMMGDGYGPGMMWGGHPHWAGKGGMAAGVTGRLESLKAELKITGGQEAAWKAYSDKVEAAGKKFWDLVSKSHKPGMMWNATPEQRLSFMSEMIRLRQVQVSETVAAAKELMPHLTDFQKGQASEILPGLARGGFGACGMRF